MWILFIVLLVVWAALSVLGFVVEGLFWIAIIGIVLFIATLIFAFIRNRIPKA